jgi:mannose-6-phosphate isomerase-like protein (cupin superfamily)
MENSIHPIIRTLKTNLEELRNITERVVPFSSTVEITKGHVKFIFEPGGGTGEAIYNEPDCAILIADIDKDSIHQFHEHPEIEILIILEGEIKITFEKKIFLMEKDETITIPSNTPHEVHYTQATRLIAITIPASADFPTTTGQDNG